MTIGPLTTAAGVSVITVNHNGRDRTRACLESIPAGVETIVVDNGSKDGSADELAAAFPSVVWIRNRSNLGFARALNQGMRIARGRRLCLVHNDATLRPGALEAMSRALDEDRSAGIAAPAPPSHGCLLVRREFVERVGPLDEAFFFTHEFADWLRRGREAGLGVRVVPGAGVDHALRGTRDRFPVRSRIEATRATFVFHRKHSPGKYPWVRLAHPFWTFLSFLGFTLTLYVRGVPRRWVEAAALLGWHLCGAPRKWGLSAGAAPRYLLLRDGWRVREETLEGFGDFDRHFAKARVVKDYKHKKTLACTVGERTYLVKVYKKSGWMRRLKSMLLGSRADHELRMCMGILERGIPTAPVVAVGERNPGSCVVFEQLPDWSQLQEVLLSDATPAPRRRSLLRAYGRFARWVQDLGVWQYDFNPTNVLVKDGEFKLIDFERMKLRPRALPARERIYLLAKMNRIGKLSRADRMRFLKGYTDAHAAEAGRLGDLAREILRQGERQKDFDLAHAADRCTGENRDYGPFEAGDVSGFYRKPRPDWPGLGIELDALLGLARSDRIDGPYRLEAVEDALAAWKEANRRAKDESGMPLAVLRRKGETRGSLVYRA